MKKFGIFIIFLFFPLVVHAEADIPNYYIDAVLQDNGDLVVQEYFYLSGSYNGMEREILYANDDLYTFRPELDYYGGSNIHNGTGLVMNEVRALKRDPNFNFQNIDGIVFSKVYEASRGDYGVYTEEDVTSGFSYLIYLPDEKNEAFYIKYTIKNLAVLHEDVGELFWNVLGTDFRESIGTLKVTITFPDNQNEFRVWAHGPLQGVVEKVNNNTLYAEVHNVYSYRAIDIRAVFDKEVISNSSKKTGVNALDKILNFEESLANQANYEREQEEYKIQERGYEELLSCELRPRRSCYENLVRYPSLIKDEMVAQDFQDRLDKLLVKVVEYEETEAKDWTNQAVLYPDYYNYENALDCVYVLTNKKLKQELLAKLEPVKEIILEQEEKYNQRAIIINGIVVLLLLLDGFILYIKCDKEYKVPFKHKYMRDFPNDFSPSTVQYLFHKGISSEGVSAEILLLIHNKVIKVLEGENKKDIILQKNEDKTENLSAKEKAIINFLFSSSNKVHLKKFKKATSSSLYNKWQKVNKKCLEEALGHELFVQDKKEVVDNSVARGIRDFVFVIIFIFLFVLRQPVLFFLGILVMLFGNKFIFKSAVNKETTEYKIKFWSKVFLVGVLIYLVVAISLLYANCHYLFFASTWHFLTLFGVAFLFIYMISIKKRTQEGALLFAKWSAFKRFLNDFGRMDEKDLPEIVLWEKYLVYAVALGCGKKLAKTMRMKIADMDVDPAYVIDPYLFMNFSVIHHAVSSSVSRVSHVASSSSSSGGSWSSGSGGGGGFSSGGGFGGGGGGGGRF